MPKIRVEVKVPEDGCKYCIMFDAEYRVCELFHCYRPYNCGTGNFERCDKCKQAEVEEAEK